MAKCLICGKDMPDKHHNGKIRKYCSNECYRQTRNLRTFGTATCAFCGKEFEETRDRPNIYCSKKCTALAKSYMQAIKRSKNDAHSRILKMQYDQTMDELKRIIYHMNHDKYCEECGAFFVAENSKQVCCSEKCSKRRENRNKDKRIYRNGEPDTSITLTKLYIRDDGTCQLCGRHLTFNGVPNGKYYPSIDHIVPLSKGGKHEWLNVQLACRKCNTIKSDTIPSPGL